MSPIELKLSILILLNFHNTIGFLKQFFISWEAAKSGRKGNWIRDNGNQSKRCHRTNTDAAGLSAAFRPDDAHVARF
jgi:hypothetical protein